MRLFFILLIALFSSHAYSFSFSLDLETITDTLEQVSEELSENAKKEETQAQDEEEKRLAKEKKLADDKAAKEKRLADDKAAKDKLEKNLSLLPSQTDLEKAQNFLINVKSFIKVYPDEFDIVKISEFLISTKPISEGKLDDVLKSNLKLFQEFTNKSNEFVKFYETNELERKNKAIEKIDQVKLSLEQNIKTLKEFLINNPDSIYTEQWVGDMKKANDILNNASNYDELVNENKRLTNVIANNEKINKVKIDAKLTVVELKENLKLNLTSDLAPLIIEQVKSLEQAIKKENIEDITLADKNAKEFIFKQFEEPKLKAAKEKKLADAKAAKEKKLADAKALEEYKKSPEGIKKEKERVKKEKEKIAKLKKEKKERLRIEKENEGRHFFVRILCRNIKETELYSEEDIQVYSAVGQLNSEDLYYVNEMYPKKACECYVKETKKTLGPERIKKVNALYKKDKKADGLMTSREQLFFNGLSTKNCALKDKLDFWIKGGRP